MTRKVVLLWMGAALLACQPVPEELIQRRLELDEELAAMRSALDQLDARLARTRLQETEWNDRMETGRLPQLKVLAPAVRPKTERVILTRVDGPGIEASPVSY